VNEKSESCVKKTEGMKRVLGIFVFTIVLWLEGFSQQYVFTNYSINNGLSQSVVNCIFQDSRDYIWIGTQNGLCRFNGESFNVFTYNPADSGSISNNWIYAIAEDRDHNLWIGTKGGLNKYLVTQNKFERISYRTGYPIDLTRYCYDLLCLRNGNILINTPPLISVYDPVRRSFTHFQSALDYDGAVKDLRMPVMEETDSQLWIGTSKGLAGFSPLTKEFSYYSFVSKGGTLLRDVQVSALFRDKKGELWVGTTSGLFHFDAVSGRFAEVQFVVGPGKRFSFENSCIRAILEDKIGNLIIGTEGRGLYVLSTSGSLPVTVQNYTSENSEIGHNIVQSLWIDRSENLWIGTLQGISKTDLKKKKFQLYRRSNAPNSLDLLGNVIASLYKDEDGIVWVGNWGQGLNLVNRITGKVEHFSTRMSGNHHIPNDFIHVIYQDSEHHIWLGTRNGLLVYDKPGNRFVPWNEYFRNPMMPTFDQIRIYMVIQDRDSNYWIATQNGLFKINLKKSTLEVFRKELDERHRLSENLIYHLLEDSDGLIWIGTVGGLDVYHPDTKKIDHYKKGDKGLSDDFIITMCEDSRKRIWVGTATYVNVFDKKDSAFTYYSQKEGLPNNRIFEIVRDRNNELWIATGKGLCKFDRNKNFFQTFTLEDGLQSLEFNLRAAYASKDGEVLLGGMNGFNAFYPDSISKNTYIPNLVFTEFYMNRGNTREYVNLEESKDLVLKHDGSSFTIEFAALEYTNPLRNNYAYKMEGISDEWIDIGNRKFVPFSALQAGEYVFKVKGSNNDGVWNEKELSLRITILPPWWKSIYAYLIYLVVIILTIVIFIKLREKNLKQAKNILEKKVLERTLQIEEQSQLIISKNLELKELNGTKDKFFSIIGHDLGNQFNIIIGFSELLVTGFNNMATEKIELHLNNIYNSSRLAHELLENLLTWAKIQTKAVKFHPEPMNVRSKVIESIEFLEGAAAKKNIKIKILAKEEIQVNADVNMFSTVVRNLLANAIKFTHTRGHIVIHLRKRDNLCEVVVQDNGVGISEENIDKIFRIDSNHSTLGTNGEKGTGLGLILCKEFIEKHNGKIHVESEVGKGSRFVFTLPLEVV
jgi:ligand-binding sensor domain-containing protein/signal transduction histidine kinase